MNKVYKKIVIKIGTNVITTDKGFLDSEILESIAEQISTLKKNRLNIIVVSSGAMGAGRSIIDESSIKGKVVKRQILASVGQIYLINTYADLFKKHSLACAQVLATKEDFRDRRHYINMKNCFDGFLAGNIIPIVNENDVVAVDELMFTDNDELAGLIASMIDADSLFILTSVDGILKNSRVIPEINPAKNDMSGIITPETSQFGRGGMLTKYEVAKKLSLNGIATHILNGKKRGAIVDIINGKEHGTKITAQKSSSSVKRWISHSEGHEKGTVYINKCAAETLRSKERAASLLPIGISKIEGSFYKGDIIKIKGENNEDIGYGMVSYGSKKALEKIGKNREKPLIHYDYLYIK